MTTPHYHRIADSLTRVIDGGQLRVGDRVPSVRDIARQQCVSPTTAVAALRELEQRGLIEARLRSGFYVARRVPAAPLPRQARSIDTPREVAIDTISDNLLAMEQVDDVVPLGAAVPQSDWLPSRKLQRRIAAVARQRPQLLSTYGPLAGLPALRRQIARHYAQFGCRLDPEELVITNGCMEALNLAIRAVAEPGAVIAVESPTYFGMLQIIESFGMKAREIATDASTGISLEELEQALSAPEGDKIKACLVVSSFSNPLGVSLTDERKQALVRLCRKFKIALIEDDIYGDLHHGTSRPLPAKTFDAHGAVILCGSFSKTLAPGARIGWIAGGAWTREIRQRKQIASLATPVLMQQVLADYLAKDRYDRHLRRLRQSCVAQLGLFSRAIAKNFPAGTRLSRPQGGYLLWVELPNNLDATLLQRKAMREKISILPGPMFSASGRFRHCLRVNCGLAWTPRVAAALRRLGQLAHSCTGARQNG